ncbi:hypothetical protein F5878DRAFT_256472 [Lentinula raphanica]|uniref:Uncharacterized protein n=1 Tax=Lentinula raphanica TaxID=153919 RepID=A0AA38UJH0_9AGAR|nr:hypothetical protein F5880DRAFT_72011 [Lentinula raphanica]KAJ3843585.1 hypothetical protein F5878DRAFT_256472 [Lentinula raphanica]
MIYVINQINQTMEVSLTAFLPSKATAGTPRTHKRSLYLCRLSKSLFLPLSLSLGPILAISASSISRGLVMMSTQVLSDHHPASTLGPPLLPVTAYPLENSHFSGHFNEKFEVTLAPYRPPRWRRWMKVFASLASVIGSFGSAIAAYKNSANLSLAFAVVAAIVSAMQLVLSPDMRNLLDPEAPPVSSPTLQLHQSLLLPFLRMRLVLRVR